MVYKIMAHDVISNQQCILYIKRLLIFNNLPCVMHLHVTVTLIMDDAIDYLVKKRMEFFQEE